MKSNVQSRSCRPRYRLCDRLIASGSLTCVRNRVTCSLVATLLVLSSLGCQSWIQRNRKEQYEIDIELIKEKMKDPDRPRLIGEVATAGGLHTRRYDSLGLISNLPGTGGIVRPSNQREFMLEELRRHDVLNPQEVLDSPSTATVKVRLLANPCDQKGDRLDVLVECSDECNATDLREGVLMPASLREYVSLGGKNRTTHEKALASGDLIVIPPSVIEGSTELDPLRAVIIGGAKLLDTPKMAIYLDDEYRHVFVIRAMEKSINRRFFYQNAGKQKVVAAGKNDREIMIEPLPKYKLDPMHYMSTIMSMGFHENEEQIAERLEGCRGLLAQREFARRAACELEGIGSKEAAEVLVKGLANNDAEVRFHAAYSLAYLDSPECVPVLQNMVRFEPAFRPVCLIGLAINECAEARVALEELLQEAVPEVRYGALWAMRQRDPRDPLIAGANVGDVCSFVHIPSQIPLVTVSLEQTKEVVLFGSNPVIHLKKDFAPSPSVRLIPMSNGMVRMAKRLQSGEILQAVVSSDLASILKGMPTIDGKYSDVVHLLDQLHATDQISVPVAINPRPRAGRVYARDGATGGEQESLDSLRLKDEEETETEEHADSSWFSLSSWTSKKLNKSADATSEGKTESESKDSTLESSAEDESDL